LLVKRSWGLFISTVLLFAHSAAAYNIDTCGQTVPDKEIGVLTTDLNCPAASTAVRVGNGATFDMNGHSITVPDGWAIWCQAQTRCTVIGGGIAGALGEIHDADTGIYLQRGTRLTAESVSIQDCVTGIQGEDWNNGRSGAGAKLTNVEITGSEGVAVLLGNVKAINVTIEGNPARASWRRAWGRSGAEGSPSTAMLFRQDATSTAAAASRPERSRGAICT
jgi:hypothetical protein